MDATTKVLNNVNMSLDEQQRSVSYSSTSRAANFCDGMHRKRAQYEPRTIPSKHPKKYTNSGTFCATYLPGTTGDNIMTAVLCEMHVDRTGFARRKASPMSVVTQTREH